MTVMTQDEIEALLAGLDSSDETWTYDPEDSKVREGSVNEICRDSTDADGAMIAAAPDLARTALALHQQLSDAKVAQTLVLERAAKKAYDCTPEKHSDAPLASHVTGRSIEAAIRALADPSGVEALAALRAERDALNVRYDDLYADALADAKSDAQDFEGELWKAIRSILDDFDYDWSGDALEDGVTANEAAEFIRDVLDGETMRADTAIAERDALAAKLAAAEARVGVLQSYYDAVEAFEDKPWKDDVVVMAQRVRHARVRVAALTTPAEETKG